VIDRSTWTPHSIFQYLQRAADISEYEMLRVFNNGLGLVIVIAEKDVGEILQRLKAMGEEAYLIGAIEPRKKNEDPVRFID
jgi:phosphoribosylformylglycinamidine cyclo-ligase